MAPTNKARAPLAVVLSAHGISLTGNAMTYLAVPWFVLDTTGDPTLTGIAAAASFLPIILSMAFGGVLVDRIGHRTASVLADGVSAVMIGLIPLLHVLDALSFPLLLILVFLGALFDAPGNAAKHALIPTLADRAGIRIERAASALDVVERCARMVGAPLAGGLIALVGPVNVLIIDAATFVVSALLMLTARVVHQSTDTSRTSYVQGLRAGFTFLWRDPLLRSIALLLAFTNLLDVAYSAVIIPVYADRVLSGAASAGLLLGTAATAAVVGGITFGAVLHRMPRWPVFVIAFTLIGLPRCIAFALEPGMALLLLVVAATGFCAGMMNPILSVAQFTRIPEQLRARTLGAVSTGAYALVAVGPVIGGGLIAAAGLDRTLIILAIAYAVAASSVIFFPVWRGIGKPAGPENDPESTTPAPVHSDEAAGSGESRATTGDR
ncbi:MFS transporter [Micromonospora sp. WMMD734]|uniref:MFS transporter n=1 Tax=Micromonospora humidisoli TaxID=2807622 RepID=A0ABS2JJG1_9ACTN|nr:MFS transporter [Micromonospora humidisoli]MBM7086661.1 MFS transporter [Micromonospora humidisoli]